MADHPYRLEDQIGFVLRKAGQRHAAIFAHHMVADLTPTQWAALVKAAEHDFTSQNQLGRETAMDAATIKGVVDRLSARGFVTALNDPNDRRRRAVALTKRGRQVTEDAMKIAARITADTLAPLTADEKRQIVALLEKLG